MKLLEYIAERGSQVRLAEKIGVKSVSIHQWANGIRQVPASRCPEIERATSGSVTCEELRPDLAEYWAYLRGTDKREAA